ncbi:hydrolase [Streptomyces spiroverticillatus]|uniref:Hydrolase n=1 Tax=Streptomyces finlayi TaxID=67296 RepID=A0A918X728_9ACTN|nr:isochorismatase family cysteine hydrolase [Streptomyces finlayi]GHA46073.1 hydrolase [Streptomyces spiroverticillatus]GHD16103.1 hydrolase [Streptomyces finlayi]
MAFGTAALIVIDVQQGFINRHTEAVVPAIADLVARWSDAGAPVLFSRFVNAPGSPYERITGWSKLRTAEEQAFVQELRSFTSKAGATIDKGQSSVFTAEAARLFSQSGWTDLVLCGIDTDSCVYDSAISAYHSGYRPWVVTDACASTGGPQYHDAALLMAARNVGSRQLITRQQALEWLGGQEVDT